MFDQHDPRTLAQIEAETIAEWVDITEMFADRYQRQPSEDKINAMIQTGVFDPDALGVICLSLRGKDLPFAGLYAIVDGNHRVECCKKLGITRIFARVYIDKTYAQEAELYEKLNNRHRITAYHLFRSRLERNEMVACDIRDILGNYGLKVTGKAEAPGSVSAVSALDRVYKVSGPSGFDEVIGIIHEAWKTERRAWISAIIDGIQMFWMRYRTEVDRDRLVTRLRQIHPDDILRNAKVGLVKRGTASTRVGIQVFETYNSGLRSSRLSDWVDHPNQNFKPKPDDKPAPDPPSAGRPGHARRQGARGHARYRR